MTPEIQARQTIDPQLAGYGWIVQGRKDMNIYAGLGVAVCEFPRPDVGEADYLLYAAGKVIGGVEAKSAEHGTLTRAESQSARSVTSLPAGVPAYHLPVPFHYETPGTFTQFTSLLDPRAPQPDGIRLPPARGVAAPGRPRPPAPQESH